MNTFYFFAENLLKSIANIEFYSFQQFLVFFVKKNKPIRFLSYISYLYIFEKFSVNAQQKNGIFLHRNCHFESLLHIFLIKKKDVYIFVGVVCIIKRVLRRKIIKRDQREKETILLCYIQYAHFYDSSNIVCVFVSVCCDRS